MELNKEQSLSLITQMITTAKHDIADNSFFLLLWGWLVFLSSLVHYVLLYVVQYKYHYIPWPIMTGIGLLSTFIYVARTERKKKVTTYVDTFMAFLWSGITVGILIVLVHMSITGYTKTYPIIMILYGIGTFTSGGILKFRPLLFGGIISWIIAVIAYRVTFDYQLLLMAAAILLAYIIPGHILKAKARED